MSSSPSHLPRRHLLQGGLALGAYSLAPQLPAFAQTAEPRLLTAGPGEAQLLPAGQPATRTWLYDGVSPGPTIRARQGEEVSVHLKNELPQPTTIHWHGIRIDNAMDGVPHLTQHAVEPGGTFDYRFTVPDAGTFWYHPHERSWEQVARGLYGLLIVEEQEPAEGVRDFAIVADDWRLGEDGQLEEASLGNMMDWSHAGRLGNILTLNRQDLLEVIVRHNAYMRLRLCNTCNARILELRIEHPGIQLVALDGQPVAPRELADGTIRLAPGERADLLIHFYLEPGSTAAITEVSGDQRLEAGRFVYHPTVRMEYRAQPNLHLPPNPLSTDLDLGNALSVALLMEGGAMGSLAQAMHEGEMKDIRTLVGAGMAWSFNGTAGMTDAPLFTAARGRTVAAHLRNAPRRPHAIPFPRPEASRV